MSRDAATPNPATTRDASVERDAGVALDAGSSEEVKPWLPAKPEGALPDCKAASYVPPGPRASTWLAYRAQPEWNTPFASYMVETALERTG